MGTHNGSKSLAVSRTIVMSLTAAIAGCGGGGGGGSSPPPIVDAPFTSWQAVQPNTRYKIPGISQTASGAMSGSGTVTSATLAPVDTAASTVQVTYNSSGVPSAITINTPQSNVTFDNSSGNSLNCSGGSCLGSTPTAAGGTIDPIAVGWNYQTFGFWAQAPTSATWISGAISVGAPTPASAVPTTGMTTFTGASAGFYVDSVGNINATAANMTANADFGARSIGFATSNTVLVPVTGGGATAYSGLDLSGNLTYSAGTNGFSGAVKTSDNSLNGTATGQFYGPNAQEIGGTYGLSAGSSVSHMLGAFGGKR
jgi:C-lobe and N-lobe beta barrels of Tf-binding protein B